MITALEIIVVILALLIIGVVVARRARTQGMVRALAAVPTTCLAVVPAAWMPCFQNDYHLIGIAVCTRVGQIDAYLLMKLMRLS